MLPTRPNSGGSWTQAALSHSVGAGTRGLAVCDSRATVLQLVQLCLRPASCSWVGPDKARNMPPSKPMSSITDFCSQKGRLLRYVGPLESPTAARACHFLGWQTIRECSPWKKRPSAHLPGSLHPAPSLVSQPEDLPLHMGSFPVTRGCCWHDRREEYSANCFAAQLKAIFDLI